MQGCDGTWVGGAILLDLLGHSKDLISKRSDFGNWLILIKREMIYFICELLNGGTTVDHTAYTFL